MPLDSEQVSKALRALYTYVARKSESHPASSTTPLFDTDDEFIYLQLSLKRTPHRATTKPIRIPLTHPIHSSPSTEALLITKDPKPSPQPLTPSARSAPLDSPAALRSYFSKHPVPGLRLMPLAKLRREYARFKDRRELLQLYDVFLADDRILSLLPAVLGVKFFDKKKQPVPVDLRVNDKAKEIRAALGSTYMFVPGGSSLAVKVGRLSFSRAEVAENVLGCVEEIVRRLPGKWRNVQMVGVKTQSSLTVPVYTSLPLQGMKEGEEEVDEEEALAALHEREREDGEEDGKERQVRVPAVRKRKRGEVEDGEAAESIGLAKAGKPRVGVAAVGASGKAGKINGAAEKVHGAQEGGEDEDEEIALNVDVPADEPPMPPPHSKKKQKTQLTAPALPLAAPTAKKTAAGGKKATAESLPSSPVSSKEAVRLRKGTKKESASALQEETTAAKRAIPKQKPAVNGAARSRPAVKSVAGKVGERAPRPAVAASAKRARA